MIKKIILIILLITSGIFYYQITDPTPPLENFEVSRVIDGDTVELSNEERVRFKGINTPESSMQFYQEAKEFLQKLIENKTIQIEPHGKDKYNRILGYVFLDNENINEEILKQGLGTLYYYEEDNHYEELEKAEEYARLNQLGLWKKSTNEGCLEIMEFKTDEPEKLILQNNCNKELEIMFKDDATHIYKEVIEANSILTKTFSHIWNTDGDSIYIRDAEGLLIFYRYD